MCSWKPLSGGGGLMQYSSPGNLVFRPHSSMASGFFMPAGMFAESLAGMLPGFMLGAGAAAPAELLGVVIGCTGMLGAVGLVTGVLGVVAGATGVVDGCCVVSVGLTG